MPRLRVMNIFRRGQIDYKFTLIQFNGVCIMKFSARIFSPRWLTKALLAAFLFYSPISAFCCLNVGHKGTGLAGHSVRSGRETFDIRYLTKAISMTPVQGVYLLIQTATDDPEFEEEIQALEWIAEGKITEAIEALLNLEEESPGNYSTAANLGVAYELAGDLDNALKWVRTCIDRNPESHHGTEWLHELILLASIEIEKNPDYLKKNQVIECNYVTHNSGQEVLIKNGNHMKWRDFSVAVLFQMKERMVFVKPRNEVVADVLVTYAKGLSQFDSLENALKILKMAQEYCLPHQGSQIDSMKSEFSKTIRFAEIRRAWIIGISTALCVLALIWLFQKKYITLK